MSLAITALMSANMNMQTCPFCNTCVIPSADGVCPSCGSMVEVMAEPEAKPAGRGLAWVLLSFQGRIPRRVFWAAHLSVTAVLWGAIIAISVILRDDKSLTGGILFLLIYAPLLYMSLAVEVKRWHDRDKSGWWVFIVLVPFIGGIWAFVETGCVRGTRGSNRYGPDPT